MNNPTKEQFIKAFDELYRKTCDFGPDFPHAWMDGFQNMLKYGHTDSDDDNTYAPKEEPSYSNYKAGARAAMIFLALKQTKLARL